MKVLDASRTRCSRKPIGIDTSGCSAMRPSFQSCGGDRRGQSIFLLSTQTSYSEWKHGHFVDPIILMLFIIVVVTLFFIICSENNNHDDGDDVMVMM